MEDDAPVPEPERQGVIRRLAAPLLVTAGVTALALGGLWIARAPIAENLIGRELAARGVRMSYRIASIGPRTQRIENIVLGDPRHPDLTARWVEVDLSLTGFYPSVAAVRAGGVRLRGSLTGGKLALGELDKFMGQPGSTETALPDLRVALNDARTSIRTDYGGLGIVLDGSGNLRSGFAGRAVMAVPHLRAADCSGEGVQAILQIRMLNGSPHLTGPLSAATLACSSQGMAMVAPRIDVDARIDDRLANAEGRLRLTARTVRAASMTFGKVNAAINGKVGGEGFRGEGRIGTGALVGPGVSADGGLLTLRFDGRGAQARLSGDLSLTDISARKRDPLAGLSGIVNGTPFAPLVAKLGKAVHDAGRDNVLSTKLALDLDGKRGDAALSALHFESASGARIDMPTDGRVALRWPDARWSFAGDVSMGGGGFPDGRLSLTKTAEGSATGSLALQPYAAGSARLALTPVRFSAARGGSSRFATAMTLDGPLADGAVRGLSLPFSGSFGPDGSLALNEGCVPVRWQALKISSLSLNPATMDLCPEEGGAMVRMGGGRGLRGGARTGAVALSGSLGSSPLNLTAATVALGLSRSAFRTTGLEARIGAGEAPVILGAEALEGQFAATGISGRFDQGRGRIGSVPLDLFDMGGRWRFAGGRLDVDGALHVRDTQAAARFNPMLAPDAHLSLVGGKIAATGQLRHPMRGGAFARIAIAHDLSSGEGNADIALQGLQFGSALQPDDLTPLALGVVANVEGAVMGGGAIHWTGKAVTSTGRFSTSGMNLAAAFGPVEGLTTTLNFTDLLAMETAPGQVATLKSVNPGVEARDGRVTFQLVANSRARIEGGEWPFAGGRLELLPSTMDFGEKGARNLIFRVTGLDAGAFINTLELKNISATGTYDGLFPMVFDAQGGRIVGGILVARQEGMPPLVVETAQNLSVPCDAARQAGTLSYVGEVSNAEMGAYGKMAFDALKKLRYKCLTILLDGAVDGEFVTRIAINGVNQGSEESRRSALLRPFLGLPFLFNVRIEAPFRGLLNTYQSFVDPSALVRGSLGPQFQTVLENKLAVQPSDSENGASSKSERTIP